MHEPLNVQGIISLYEYPSEWNDADFAYWWLPEISPLGEILRPARLSDEARRQRLVMPPVKNLITNLGLTLLLSNMSNTGQGSLNPFFQILSVGNGAITTIARTDVAVAGDAFGTNCRKAPASFSTSGFQSTIIVNYASGDAQATWTNVGIYGYKVASSQSATTSAGTGALMTHAFLSFVKGASAIAVDYALILSN